MSAAIAKLERAIARKESEIEAARATIAQREAAADAAAEAARKALRDAAEGKVDDRDLGRLERAARIAREAVIVAQEVLPALQTQLNSFEHSLEETRAAEAEEKREQARRKLDELLAGIDPHVDALKAHLSKVEAQYRATHKVESLHAGMQMQELRCLVLAAVANDSHALMKAAASGTGMPNRRSYRQTLLGNVPDPAPATATGTGG